MAGWTTGIIICRPLNKSCATSLSQHLHSRFGQGRIAVWVEYWLPVWKVARSIPARIKPDHKFKLVATLPGARTGLLSVRIM